MRFNRFGALVAFLAAAVAVALAWLKKIAGQTAALDAAEKKAGEAAAVVEEKRADLAAVDRAAEAAHLAVEKRLAELDRHIAEERARDSVDVANDIIGGK
jgi:Tfp pilus assembly protein PilO